MGGCPGSSNFEVGCFNLSLMSFFMSLSNKSQSREMEDQRMSLGSGPCCRSTSLIRGAAYGFLLT